ncbi:amidohydrolase family protein [Actinospica sp.]|jgi:enamidase|uniref:amidohydrolase family protein n=1 Tax=Actinospica sp. TaxID=1872142 RepID=UPI002B7CA237|nr:amidohydrolase family protein [Actinospica sp.]HWG24592.1 amidohydrolase family protein [Actinospica sp.]
MRTLIRGASAVVSGLAAAPLLDADALIVDGTLIEQVGPVSTLDTAVDRVIDVNGAVLAPGLIDPHTHPVLGDFTPRQNTLGWVGSHLNGGVTTLISAGETHWPGRQRTPIGAKAIAIAAALSSAQLRPSGAKLHGGALLIEPGLGPADFDEMAAAGVRLVGEVGLGSSMDPERIREPIELARSRGWVVPMHVGGASVPGSHVVGSDMVLELRPDVVCHANGGPTARPLHEIEEILAETESVLEVVQAGNTWALTRIVTRLLELGRLDRLQFGTDSPSGTGILPLGMLRTLAYSAAFAGLDPATALCLASGSVAARYGLDVGVIAPGCPADLVVLDVPLGGQGEIAFDSFRHGDVPSVALVMVDGEVLVRPSRVTPPPTRAPLIS